MKFVVDCVRRLVDASGQSFEALKKVTAVDGMIGDSMVAGRLI